MQCLHDSGFLEGLRDARTCMACAHVQLILSEDPAAWPLQGPSGASQQVAYAGSKQLLSAPAAAPACAPMRQPGADVAPLQRHNAAFQAGGQAGTHAPVSLSALQQPGPSGHGRPDDGLQ